MEGDRVSREATRAQQDVASRIGRVEEKHPGWQETVKSPEFEAWFGKQPSYLQRISKETEEPGEMIEVMDKFVADTKPPAADDPPKDEAAEREAAAAAAAAAAAERRALIDPNPKGKPARQEPKGTVSENEAYWNGWNAADKDLDAMRA